MSFVNELRQLINKHSKENGSDTPDFILAEYMERCLDAFHIATMRREQWCGRAHVNIILQEQKQEK